MLRVRIIKLCAFIKRDFFMNEDMGRTPADESNDECLRLKTASA